MTNQEANLNHCVFNIATYAKNLNPHIKSFPHAIEHKIIACSFVSLHGSPSNPTVNVFNALGKNSEDDSSIVGRITRAVGSLDPDVQLVTFWGGCVAILFYRCMTNGVSAPALFVPNQIYPRKNRTRHLEFQDLMSNSGTLPLFKKSDYLVRLLGLPPLPQPDKMVEWADAGKWARVKSYLATDVFCTTLLWLRYALVSGLLSEDQEVELMGLVGEKCGEKSKAVRRFANDIFEDAEEDEA